MSGLSKNLIVVLHQNDIVIVINHLLVLSYNLSPWCLNEIVRQPI